MRKNFATILLFILVILPMRTLFAVETFNVALTSKAFLYMPLVIAQDRGYMKEEGIELKFVFMQNAPGLQP